MNATGGREVTYSASISISPSTSPGTLPAHANLGPPPCTPTTPWGASRHQQPSSTHGEVVTVRCALSPIRAFALRAHLCTRSVGCACAPRKSYVLGLLDAPVCHILCRTLSRFGRPKCEFGAQSGANCPACTNCGDLPGKVSENCTIRRAKWGSAARWLRSAVHLFVCLHLESPCRDLGAQNANLGPGLAQIAQPVRIAEICLGKSLKTVLFGAPNGGRLPHGSDGGCAECIGLPITLQSANHGSRDLERLASGSSLAH